MAYTFTLIKSKSDCDSLISIAEQMKDDLGFRKLSLERQVKAATSTTISVETELLSVNAEIEALTNIIAGLPDGETKDETVFKKKKLEYKAMILNERKDNYGAVSLVDKEFDIGCIEKQVEECDSFIEAVTAHKNTL